MSSYRRRCPKCSTRFLPSPISYCKAHEHGDVPLARKGRHDASFRAAVVHGHQDVCVWAEAGPKLWGRPMCSHSSRQRWISGGCALVIPAEPKKRVGGAAISSRDLLRGDCCSAIRLMHQDRCCLSLKCTDCTLEGGFRLDMQQTVMSVSAILSLAGTAQFPGISRGLLWTYCRAAAM